MTEAYTDDRRDGGGGVDNETEAANINGDPANTDGITIVIHDKPEDSSFDEKDIENIKNISKCHIITGCITIFLQVATVLFPHSIMFVVYEGVVTGLIFIVTGIIGTCYIIKKRRPYLSCFLVLSIFASLMSATLLAFAIVRIVQAYTSHHYNTNYYYGDVFKVLASFEVVMAIIQGVTSITGSTICCKEFCCSKNSPRRAHYKDRTIQVLSSCQIGIGAIFFLVFFLNFFLIRAVTIFDEIWCGLAFIVIGIVGLLSINRFYKLVTAFLVLNIIGCIFSIVLISFTGVRMSQVYQEEIYQKITYQFDLRDLQSDYYNCTEKVLDFQKFNKDVERDDFVDIERDVRECEKMKQEEIKRLENALVEMSQEQTRYDTYFNILVVQLLLVILEMVILVTTAGLVCHVCCCCCAAAQQLDTTAVYIPAKQLNSGQSVVHISRERQGPGPQEEMEGTNYARFR